MVENMGSSLPLNEVSEIAPVKETQELRPICCEEERLLYQIHVGEVSHKLRFVC